MFGPSLYTNFRKGMGRSYGANASDLLWPL